MEICSWYSVRALARCGRIRRGEVGAELGSESESRDNFEAERGFAASLRQHLGNRQLLFEGAVSQTHASLQYKIELHGVMICFSHIALGIQVSELLTHINIEASPKLQEAGRHDLVISGNEGSRGEGRVTTPTLQFLRRRNFAIGKFDCGNVIPHRESGGEVRSNM